MSECEVLGREIGLQKRVVQVWFQNARAKEKKAKGCGYHSEFSDTNSCPNVTVKEEGVISLRTDRNLSPPPPEECKLCNHPYTSQCSIQDHVFTKKHLLRIISSARRTFEPENIKSNTDLFEDTNRNYNSSTTEIITINQPHPITVKTCPNVTVKSSGTSINCISPKVSQKPPISSPAPTPASASPSLSNLFPFLYAGGTFPFSMPDINPRTAPGFDAILAAAASANMTTFDPTTHGTPLSLLQIPPDAINRISFQLPDPSLSVTHYMQDSMTIELAEKMVLSKNLAETEKDSGKPSLATIDVGYICRKCQLVYPGQETCIKHQLALCYTSGSPSQKTILKLEQGLYKCTSCANQYPTVVEYMKHLDSAVHTSP